MADKRSGKLEKMNIIFSQALKGIGVGKEFFSHMVLFYWPRIVGKHISANVKPVKIEFNNGSRKAVLKFATYTGTITVSYEDV